MKMDKCVREKELEEIYEYCCGDWTERELVGTAVDQIWSKWPVSVVNCL